MGLWSHVPGAGGSAKRSMRNREPDRAPAAHPVPLAPRYWSERAVAHRMPLMKRAQRPGACILPA